MDLYPNNGQPAAAPWRLALVTILQFAENLSDRQAADAVRSRIDWKYLLGMPLTDSGFHYSVLCEFRKRLIEGQAVTRLLERMLELFQAKGLLTSKGRQRTDSTHIVASVRDLSRLELVGTALFQALNHLAIIVPEWVKDVVPTAWTERYQRQWEDYRLPKHEHHDLNWLSSLDAMASCCYQPSMPVLSSLG
jgi:transposase